MYSDNNERSSSSYDANEKNDCYMYSREQYQKGIKIPPPNNTVYDFKNETGNRYENAYDDILSFTSEDDIKMHFMHNNNQYAADDDPMEDKQFMAFLSSVSTSEPTLTTSPPLLLLQSHNSLSPDLSFLGSPSSLTPFSINSTASTSDIQKCISTGGKKPASAKLGQCEHPKHVLYRQERYTLLPACSPAETSIMKTVPRRGRPPKGSKTSEYLFSTSPINSKSGIDLPQYPIVELTVRQLPRRLEAVVGKTNIKVCLTCLKRSDTDSDYLKDHRYIGPQQILKRTKKSK